MCARHRAQPSPLDVAPLCRSAVDEPRAAPLVAAAAAPHRGVDHGDDLRRCRARLDPGRAAEHVRDEHSTFTWLLEPMIELAGFELVDATYSASGMLAQYLCKKR
jgi:hypothetical protein